MFISKEKLHALLLADFGDSPANAPDSEQLATLHNLVTQHDGRILDSTPNRLGNRPLMRPTRIGVQVGIT